MHNDHQRLFFLHIPKAAGMTLHAIIERQYEPEQIYTIPAVPWNDMNRKSLAEEWTAENKQHIRVVKGHMDYGWHDAFEGDTFEYTTILRHPVERVLSLYSFIGEWHDDWTHKQEGIARFVLQSREAQNGMTYMLSGGIGREAEAFRVAWDNLTQMPVVGTVQNFDRYLQDLRDRYGWETEAYERVNKTADRTRDITPDEERRILAHNVYDMMLYLYAERKHEQNI